MDNERPWERPWERPPERPWEPPPRQGDPAPRADGPEPDGDAADAARVTRFLRANPHWLAEQHGLYETLTPPRRVHGEALADHMAAMIDAARAHSRSVLRSGRAGLGLDGRVRDAVLALMRAHEPADWIGFELPRALGLDAARLCSEGAGPPGAAPLPAGTVRHLLGGREVLLRSHPARADAVLLHGEAAAGLALHDALLRVPLPGAPPTLLALASRDAGVLEGAGAEGALGFLAAALAARLERPG